MSANDDLQDLAITHAHYVERFQNHELDKIQALIGRATKELRLKLLDANITNWTRKRIETMIDTFSEIMKGYNGELQTMLTNDLKGLATVEGSFSLGMLKKVVKPLLTWSFTAPSPAQLWSAAIQNPLMFEDGFTQNLKPYLSRLSSRNLDAATMTLRQGVIQGKTSVEIARDLYRPGSVMQGSRSFAELITRTATNHVSSMARKATAGANEDIVKGYEWVSTLDRRTSVTCQWRDGKVWMYDEDAKVDRELLEGEVYPPAHPRCRSTITYILKSWRELGFDQDEVPESTRASMDGQVPEGLNYRQWLKRQPASVQKDVLGQTRYRMLREGEIDVDQFYTRDGRRLTLKQLEEKGFDTEK